MNDSSDSTLPQAFTNLEWDENGQPISTQFDDIYFSKVSGIDETRYVFIDANNLTDRWKKNDQKIFTIAETGFGTGLNFLVAWHEWKNSNPKHSSQQLHFISVEKYPLNKDQLSQALSLWPELSELSKKLIENYPPHAARGTFRLLFDEGKIALTLFFGDALTGFEQLSPIPKPGPKIFHSVTSLGHIPFSVDAWFLDGFAPSKNPDMWTQPLYAKMAELSNNTTTFATFTSAGSVRRGLQQEGFECSKRKGFGSKREMLYGTFKNKATKEFSNIRHSEFSPSWALIKNSDQQTNKQPESALVIGAGLAGCHTAYALAKRGLKVTVIERNDTIADEASGNLQGAVYTRLSPHNNPLSRFNLASQLFADHFYNTNHFFESCGGQCGVVHLAMNSRQEEHYLALCKAYENDRHITWLPKDKSESSCGFALKYDGMLLPQSGWLSPKQLCAELTSSPSISVVSSTEIAQLKYREQKWVASNEEASFEFTADIAVIANAGDALRLEQTSHLPLKQIRGQVTHLPVNTQSSKLSKVLCGDGYIAPAREGYHSVGATFTLHDHDDVLKDREHQQNITNLCAITDALSDSLSNFSPRLSDGRVGFRCTTPDYFPIVGPVPVVEDLQSTFAFYRKKANAFIDEAGSYYPQLFTNLGHGSRGLAYTPIAAETIANLATGSALPLETDLFLHLHPARFVIRNLMRNKD